MTEKPIKAVAELASIEYQDEDIVVLKLDCIDQQTGEPVVYISEIPRDRFDQMLDEARKRGE